MRGHKGRSEAAFEPRNRLPKTSPTALAPDTVELIVRVRKELTEQGLDAGLETIAWHLQQHHTCVCRGPRSATV